MYGMQKGLLARELAENNQALAASDAYLTAAACGYSIDAGTNRALSLALDAGDAKRALKALLLRAENGSSDYENVESNNQFNDVVALKGWAYVRAKMIANKSRPKPEKSSSTIHTDDLKHFLDAFERAEGLEGQDALAVYDQFYFTKASQGLIDYASVKIIDPLNFTTYVQDRRPFYAQLKRTYTDLLQLEDKALAALYELAGLVGSNDIPTIYYLVGRHTSGGTATKAGILLGAEFIGTDMKYLDSIRDWVPQFISTPNDSLWVILHEHVHYIQSNSANQEVMKVVLNEGAADFLADFIYGPPTKTKAYRRYGACHEERIRQRFLETMDTDESRLWVGNNSFNYDNDWHADLGYYLGAQIIRAYYQQSEDKTQALADIASLKHAEQIWQDSGYATMQLTAPPSWCKK